MLSPYRRVLSVPGAWQFSLAGFFGRLPIAMVSLGIVLLVSAQAGLLRRWPAPSRRRTSLANALLAIVHGRLVDRFGQHRVLPSRRGALRGVTVPDDVGGRRTAGTPLAIHALAAVAGGALPQIGACVRARWSHVLDDTSSRVQTAYAFESVVDEALFVTGPTVVTVSGDRVGPGRRARGGDGRRRPLGGVLWLSTQRSTEPPDHRQRASAGDDSARAPMPWRIVAPLVVVCVSLGACLRPDRGGHGRVRREEHGAKALAGPLLGVWALGSLVAGLVTGLIAWRTGPEMRVRLGHLWRSVLTLVPLVGSLSVMALFLLLGGMAIAPTLIATLSPSPSAACRSPGSPRGWRSCTPAWASASPRAPPLGGLMIDAYGASPAYARAAPCAGLLGAAAAWLTRTSVASTP